MRSRALSSLALAGLLTAAGANPLPGQQTTPPWPDGCSIRAPLFVQNGLDAIFFGACDRHDRCWAECNGPSPPYLGLGHKAACDSTFLAQMELACGTWAGLLAFPGSGWEDADAFLQDCSELAGVMFAGVNVPPIAFNIFWDSQCFRGCNRDACDLRGADLPDACGQGQCYFLVDPPPPPPPPPPPDPDPCGSAITETSTWIAGGSRAASHSVQQLSTDLQRFERRDESHIYLEEWALVDVGSAEPRVRTASTEIFREQVEQSVLPELPGQIRPGELLVVQGADHQRNGRYTPTPSLVPFETETDPGGLAAFGAPADVWFRAEVDPKGRVDRVSLLDPSQGKELDAKAVRGAIRKALRVEYQDERRHRTIVFARGRVTPSGRVVVRGNGLVLVPQCCCGETFCV